MSSQSSRRLIDAAAALQPADRALLNLSIHRGLDDDRLASLTGMSEAAVQARRERIIADLGGQLGEAPEAVLAGLRALNASDPEPELDPTPPSPAAAEPTAVDPAPPSSRRHRWWAALAAAAAIVVAVVLTVLLSGGGSSPTPAPSADGHAPATASAAPATAAPATPTTTQTTTPTSGATPATATTPGDRPTALTALPGGLRHVSGKVTLAGRAAHLTLRLMVKGLPLIHHAHYEAWLYNSVIDSRPLGHVTRHATNTYRLPSGARRYRFLDISVQPKGSVNHSGESEVRALNPAQRRRGTRSSRASTSK